MAHPIDSLHLKITLPAIFILAALTAHSILDLPYCWTPAHFTGAHVAYARNACGQNSTHAINKGWAFPQLFFNLMAEAVITVTVYFLSCHVTSLLCEDSFILNTAWKKSATAGKVSLLTGNRIRQLLCSSNIAILYFLTQLLAFNLWLLAFFFIPDVPDNMLMLTSDTQVETKIATQDSFICDFHVRIMGNIQWYSVQCQLPTYGSLQLAIAGNKVLCLMMALATTVHLCYTFIIASLMQRKKAQLIIEAAGIPPVKMGLSYGLTDLYMTQALSLSGPKNKDGEIEG